jgi:hypothetical protein
MAEWFVPNMHWKTAAEYNRTRLGGVDPTAKIRRGVRIWSENLSGKRKVQPASTSIPWDTMGPGAQKKLGKWIDDMRYSRSIEYAEEIAKKRVSPMAQERLMTMGAGMVQQMTGFSGALSLGQELMKDYFSTWQDMIFNDGEGVYKDMKDDFNYAQHSAQRMVKDFMYDWLPGWHLVAEYHGQSWIPAKYTMPSWIDKPGFVPAPGTGKYGEGYERKGYFKNYKRIKKS